MVLWLFKHTASGFCKKTRKSITVPVPRITPCQLRDAARMEAVKLKITGFCREARVAEGALPELARLGRRMPPGTGFQGHVTLQPGGCQQLPSAGCAALLTPSSDFLRQLIALRESRRNENWQKRADTRFIHHQF